jgi:hypothetical protein
MFTKTALLIAIVTLLAAVMPIRAEAASGPAGAASSASPALPVEALQSFPVVPTLSARALAIYRQGLALGNNPRGFTKIGDGEIAAPWFTTIFDVDPRYYALGPYDDLRPVIDYFSGSYGRKSQAARAGFNTTSIFNAALADPKVCAGSETPLACELRLHRPSFAIISLGTNQVYAPEVFEPGLRKIIDTLISQGVVPILSTKGDNLEGNYRINRIVAQLAAEYELPLWNFWLAVQPLPNHGLQPDFEHLTWAKNDFGNPWVMQRAWPVRNLTALQTLNAMRMAVEPVTED